jgi:pimeloyl-ACP methyl ester carboxylesterase
MTAHPSRIPAPDLARWIRACAAARAFWDLWRDGPSWRAPEPACPTTIAWGAHDRLLLFSRQAPRARRRIPHADHVVLHGCGHVPTWDDSDAVAQVLLRASA